MFLSVIIIVNACQINVLQLKTGTKPYSWP